MRATSDYARRWAISTQHCVGEGLRSFRVPRRRRDVHSRESVNKVFIAILAAFSVSLVGCDLFPEVFFDLAPESRLPKWLTLPPGLSRPDVAVRMYCYVKPTGRTAKFILRDLTKNEELAEANGTLKGAEPLQLSNPRPGSSGADLLHYG